MVSKKTNKFLPELNQESIQRVNAVSALPSGAHIHFSGICGTGMAAVASLCKQLGFKVSGSDKAFYPPMGPFVRDLVDEVFEGYSKKNISNPDLVVIGNNLRSDNEEVLAVEQKGISFASMPEVFSALLIGDKSRAGTSVVVAGTHGKTTTSCMIGTMLEIAGKAPGYFVGGIPNSLPSNVRPVDFSRPAAERIVVLEGDEYDSAFFAKWPKFHSYRPDIVVLTSLEFDHADIYEGLEQVEEEFYRLSKRIPKGGYLVLHDELKSYASLWQNEIEAEILLYGEDPESDFVLLSRAQVEDGQALSFKLGKIAVEFKTSEVGLHNALNLLASAAVGELSGLSVEQIEHGLNAFVGVERRQRIVGDYSGLTLIEDFAHHPTAVRLTLDGLKERYPGRRLVAVFEPRSNTSRRHFFQEEYSKSFNSADVCFFKEVEDSAGYSATSTELVSLDVKKLCEKLGDKAKSFSEIESILEKIIQNRQDGDVLVIMSNGDFGGLLGKLTSAYDSIF